MNRQKIAQNIVTTVGTQALSWALTLFVTLYLPRYVGDVGLGKLAFAAAFVGVFSVVVRLGTSNVLVKEIAKDRSRTPELLASALTLRFPLALISILVAVWLPLAWNLPELTRALILWSAAAMVIATVNDAFASALQGQERLGHQNLASLVEKVLASAGTIALVYFKAPLWTFAAVGLGSGSLSLLVQIWALFPYLKQIRPPSLDAVRLLFVAGMPFLWWTVFRTLYGSTDPIILGLTTNDATVGWYSAAFRLVGSSLFIPGAITTALLPTLTRLNHTDQDGFRKLSRHMLGIVMLCGVPLALVLLLAPAQALALLHYPPSFNSAIPVMRIGGIGVLLYYTATVLGTAVIATDNQKHLARCSMYAILLGIPACVLGSILGHRYLQNGAVGAIASDVLVEMYLVGNYFAILPRGTFDRECLLKFCRCGLAAVLALSLLLFWPGSAPGLWVLLPCGCIYALACILLGCIDRTSLETARTMFSNRKRPAEA